VVVSLVILVTRMRKRPEATGEIMMTETAFS